MEELEKLLLIPKDLSESEIGKEAVDKAKVLMSEYVIKKQVDNEVRFYYLNNIELYYYSPNHRDTCVHPHYFKKAGSFRVHYSGVDITFASNLSQQVYSEHNIPEKKKKAGNYPYLEYKEFMDELDLTYGGFLIREIQEVGTSNKIIGPWCVLCELYNFEGEALHLSIEKGEHRHIKVTPNKRVNVGGAFSDNKYAYKVER